MGRVAPRGGVCSPTSSDNTRIGRDEQRPTDMREKTSGLFAVEASQQSVARGKIFSCEGGAWEDTRRVMRHVTFVQYGYNVVLGDFVCVSPRAMTSTVLQHW
jgi:hypothetical protein